METNSITDYLQSIQDLIPAIQMGLFPDPTIGTVYHVLSESGTDFKVDAMTTQGTQSGAATFDVVLLRNDFIEKFRPLAWR